MLLFLGCLLLVLTPAFAGQPDAGTSASLFSSLRIFVPEKQLTMDDIVLPDLNGRIQAIRKQPGIIIFVTFWASWCPDCRREMPAIERLFRRFKDKGLAIVAINLMEFPGIVRVFRDKYDLTFLLLLDQIGETGRRFALRSIPTSYLLDNKGTIIGRIDGARDWDSEESYRFFDLLLSDGSLAPPLKPKS